MTERQQIMWLQKQEKERQAIPSSAFNADRDDSQVLLLNMAKELHETNLKRSKIKRGFEKKLKLTF